MNTISHWLMSVRDWLDARGRPAWFAAMIIGFIFVWPVGLGILFYMIGSNRMKSCSNRKSLGHFYGRNRFHAPSTGNVAFDTYRDETLRRLEEEQSAFQAFVQRLREAKDKAEFDQFMDDRKNGAPLSDAEPA